MRNDIVKLEPVSFCESSRPTSDSRNLIIWIFDRKSGNIENARETHKNITKSDTEGEWTESENFKENSEDNFKYEELKK